MKSVKSSVLKRMDPLQTQEFNVNQNWYLSKSNLPQFKTVVKLYFTLRWFYSICNISYRTDSLLKYNFYLKWKKGMSIIFFFRGMQV